jgi:uncharacterized protein (TIRG00374 family)
VKKVPRALKIGVACVLLALLALGVDWHSLPGQLARTDWRLATLGLCVTALQMIANASKWSWSLRLHDLRFAWPYLFRSSCIGYFFNNVLPSGIGGDVYRVYRTLTPGVRRSRAVSAVLVERIIGFGVLLATGAMGAFLLARTSGLARGYLLVAGAVALCLLAFAALVILARMERVRRRVAHIAWLEPLRDNLKRVLRARPEWLGLVAASCAFHVLAISVVWLAFAAVGSPLSIAAAAVVTAAAGIASVLPVSISGLGVVEGSIVGAAVAAGSDYDAAVLAALVVRLQSLGIGAGCGLLYLADRGKEAEPPSPEMAA